MPFRVMPNANIDAPVSHSKRDIVLGPRGPFAETILIPSRGAGGPNKFTWPVLFTKAFKSFI